VEEFSEPRLFKKENHGYIQIWDCQEFFDCVDLRRARGLRYDAKRAARGGGADRRTD
jgi:hypothetical protein